MCYCLHFVVTYPECVFAKSVANVEVEILAPFPITRAVRGGNDKDRALGAYGQVLLTVMSNTGNRVASR